MKKLSRLALTGMSLAIVSSLLIGTQALAKGEKYELVSKKLDAPITLEATNPAWKNAPGLKMVLSETPYKPNGFPGVTNTNIVLKSLHDKDSIYVYLQYEDPTASVARFPWIKQEDGSWKQLHTKDQTGHENNNYEDKVAFLWDINTKGFAKKGCAIACHTNKNGLVDGIPDMSAGRKYTRKEGQTIDMWHWKSVRTGLAFDLSHDQYIDHMKNESKGWGRHGDDKLSGGYKNNITKDKKTPMYMSKNPKNTLTYLKDSDKISFVDTFKAGDMVPGIIVSKMSGSAADIQTSSVYADGKWTLVFKRALITTGKNTKKQDVEFTDLSKGYYFGVAVFDNTQINHVYHDGSIRLLFK